MRLEIVSATDFLVHLLRLQAGQLTDRQLELFKSSLTDVLRRRYRDHWFPDKPNRGSGYRCLRINGKIDPVIAQAGANVGLLPTVLHNLFPRELTMWIDPAEVSYRIGENGSICVLFESSNDNDFDDNEITSRPSSSSSSINGSSSSISSLSSSSTSSSPTTIIASPPPPSSQYQHNHHHYHHNNQYNNHYQQQQQQQQQFESCKDSLILEHAQFNEQIAAFVSS